MKYNITTSPVFDKEVKILAKKHPSLKADILKLIKTIDKELILGVDLGNNFKKIRLNISSKGKGKAGGARLITFETIIDIENTDLLFATIYNKSEFDTINIDILKKNLEL